MANLKDIKNRILSVESTKKITRAMKMVAAAKVKKSETAVVTSRPYTKELVSMFQKLLNSVTEFSSDSLKIKSAIDDYPALLKTREIKSIGILVMTSNKGLAGAYNANIIKSALKRVAENEQNGVKTVIYPIGQKAISAFKHRNGNYELKKGYISIANEPTATGANLIA